MKYLCTAVFVVLVLGGGSALWCYTNEDNGSLNATLVEFNTSYKGINGTNDPTGACGIDRNGYQWFENAVFGGNATEYLRQSDRNFTMCFCASDGCNFEMPPIDRYLMDPVNCTDIAGDTYQCGIPFARGIGNKCGLVMDVLLTDLFPAGALLYIDHCMISFGDRGCLTSRDDFGQFPQPQLINNTAPNTTSNTYNAENGIGTGRCTGMFNYTMTDSVLYDIMTNQGI